MTTRGHLTPNSAERRFEKNSSAIEIFNEPLSKDGNIWRNREEKAIDHAALSLFRIKLCHNRVSQDKAAA